MLQVIMIIQIAAVPLLIGNLIVIQTCSSSLDVVKQQQQRRKFPESESVAEVFFPPLLRNNNISTETILLSHVELSRMPNFISDEPGTSNMLMILNVSDSQITSRAEEIEDGNIEEEKQSSKQANAKYNRVQFESNQKNLKNRNFQRRSLSSLLYSSEFYSQTSSSSFVESDSDSEGEVDISAGNDIEENVGTTENSISQNMTRSTIDSTSEDTSDVVPPYMKHMTIILVILHVSVFITGLVGNLLVCLSVYRNKSLQTVTNYYIVNLAVADFLVILICLPPTVYWDLTLTWNFGLVLCKLVLYLQSISVSVSVLTLTCISIDRWYAICRPLEFSSTKYRAKITIALIWVVSMLIASPDVMFLTTRPLYEENNFVYMDCTYSWPESSTKMYQLCIVTLLFVCPFVLMSISYSHLVNVLWRNETMADSIHHTSLQLEEEQQFLKRKYESMSAIHEDGDGASRINHKITDTKNKSKLAIVTATATEVDYIHEKENSASNRIGEKRSHSKNKIDHEKRASQSNDITTNVDINASLTPTEVTNQYCKNILEMDVKASHEALYTHAIDQAFSKQQDSNCYQTSVTRADATSYNKPDWRSTQMQQQQQQQAPNCKGKLVRRKFSEQEANTRYPRELMPMATTNLNPSSRRRHTIESHGHKHYARCCEINYSGRCIIENHASTFIGCLVSPSLVPSHTDLQSKSLAIDGMRIEASISGLFQAKPITDLCSLNYGISNKNKVNNLATGSAGSEKTSFKFNDNQSVGSVEGVAGGEAIDLGVVRLACDRKSIRESLVPDDRGSGKKHRQNLAADDVCSRVVETRTRDKFKSDLGQPKDGAEFNAIKDVVALPKLSGTRQKMTTPFQPTGVTQEICCLASKMGTGNRHISENICREIKMFSGGGKNLDPEKLISANNAEKRARKNLANSLAVDMSCEVITTTEGEKTNSVDCKELDEDPSGRGSSCIGCSVDNRGQDSEEQERGACSTLMTTAATPTNEFPTNGKEVTDNSTLKLNTTNFSPLNCCDCLMESLRKKRDKLKTDRTLKKYRKNLANYAANKERYRDTTNSSRITRQTMFTSSFLEGDQPTLSKSSNRRRFDSSQDQANQSSSTRCYLNIETSTNISKDGSNRDHQNSGHSKHLAAASNDHSPSLASNSFNHQQIHAPNNTRFYKLIESRKKAAKMLIVIVIMFGLCYLPIHFLNTLRYTIGLPQNDITTIASLVSHWLCYFNSAINPLIYNLMSGKFRHEFANLFFCKCFRRNTN